MKNISIILLSLVACIAIGGDYTDRQVRPWSLGWVDPSSAFSVDWNGNDDNNYALYGTGGNNYALSAVGGVHTNTSTKSWNGNFNMQGNPSKDRSLSFWYCRGPNIGIASGNSRFLLAYDFWWVGYYSETTLQTYGYPYQGAPYIEPLGVITAVGTWEHFALTANGTTGQMIVYRNGVVVGNTASSSATNAPASSSLWLCTITGGGEPSDINHCTASQFDDLFGVARVLSSNEVVNIYRFGRNTK